MNVANKPDVRIFIGTTAEQEKSIPVLVDYLKKAGLDSLPWTEAFTAGDYTLEALFKALTKTNAGIFLMTLDDKRWYRHKTKDETPRDNLIFEAGLWISRYGRRRVLILVLRRPNQRVIGLPTDLSGLTLQMVKLSKSRDIVPVLRKQLKKIRGHFEKIRGIDPEPLRLHPSFKPLLAQAPDNVFYVETAVGPWTHVDHSIIESIRSPEATQVDVLASYQVGELLRDIKFRARKEAVLRVCLSDMYDAKLLAIYMRKYRDDRHNEDDILNKFESSIRAVLGDSRAKIKGPIKQGRKIRIGTSVKDEAAVEVYLTSQRIATSYYRIDDVAWIIPLDAKKARDPAPMCWGISRETTPSVFKRYHEEFNAVLKEARRVYP